MMRGKYFVLIICLGIAFILAGPIYAADLYNEKMLTTGEPRENKYTNVEPGESQLLPRGHMAAPPMIPHSIEGMETTLKSNECLDCHQSKTPDIPQIPPSHLQDFKTQTMSKDLNMARYFCKTCHAPQTSDELPVKNRFQILEGVVNPAQRATAN
jgi:cytochrome c-type protein NapB